MKLVVCFILLVWQACFFIAQADELNTPSAEINDEDDGPDIELGDMALGLVDEMHDVLSDNLISISDQLDNFFVAERMESEGSNTRVIFSYFISEDIHANFDNDYFFKAQLSLPKTENRLRLVVESTVNQGQDDEEAISVGSGGVERKLDLSTGLQFIFYKTKLWQISNTTGVRIVLPPDPFSQLRLRRLFFYKSWIIRFIETFFISNTEGFGESTELDLEHAVGKSLYFRSRTDLVVTEKNDATFSQSFSVYQPLTDRQMLVYSTGIDSVVRQPLEVSRYYINMRFRHNFYKKWAFYEVVPELQFERENDFDMLPIFFFKLDFVIGKI